MSEALSTSPASPPSAWPDLAAEHRAAGLAEHARSAGRPSRCASCGQRVAHRRHDVLGDRLDELLPDVDGLLDPLGAAPGRGRGDAGGELGGGVEPVVGEPQRVRDRGALPVGRGRGRAARPRCDGRRPWPASSSPSPRAAPSSPASGSSAPTGRASRPPACRPAPGAWPPNALKICSNGVPLKGLGCSSSGRRSGSRGRSSWAQTTRHVQRAAASP